MAEDVTLMIRRAYDRRAEERDRRAAPAWETAERDDFLELVLREHRQTLLELGAGTGNDSKLFAESGLSVICIDLSPGMVQACKAKGLTAQVMDVTDLGFPPDCFDAVYAMNCLVHVPKRDLEKTLEAISRVLKVDGLFYLGLYGGRSFEGIWDADTYEPKRFFSHYPDNELSQAAEQRFEVETFRRIERGWAGLHFQSLTLRKPRCD